MYAKPTNAITIKLTGSIVVVIVVLELKLLIPANRMIVPTIGLVKAEATIVPNTAPITATIPKRSAKLILRTCTEKPMALQIPIFFCSRYIILDPVINVTMPIKAKLIIYITKIK